MTLKDLVASMRFSRMKPATVLNPRQSRLDPSGALLTEVPFSPNPGNLRMYCYLPEHLKDGAPLVVTLHGCGQTANDYDQGAGWCALAEEAGFAVLAPEQKTANNPRTCFNWFNSEDITRGQGECASIAAMIAAIIDAKRLDRAKVFVTGLSAGGAMTSVMLATYPELFCGGAIIAGLPYGAAANLREAMDAMRSAPLRTPQQWGQVVRRASEFKGPWPKVSIWHGALDTTVNINNAQACVAQWADIHGLVLTSARQELVGGAVRMSWNQTLEVYTLPTLGHGTPIDSHDVGNAAPFILEAGISSSRLIAQFWGLLPNELLHTKPSAVEIETAAKSSLTEIEVELGHHEAVQPMAENLIRRALKAVGLLKR